MNAYVSTALPFSLSTYILIHLARTRSISLRDFFTQKLGFFVVVFSVCVCLHFIGIDHVPVYCSGVEFLYLFPYSTMMARRPLEFSIKIGAHGLNKELRKHTHDTRNNKSRIK